MGYHPVTVQPRILVIANPDDAVEIMRGLGAEGFASFVVDGGEASLVEFVRSPPDVVILFAELSPCDPRVVLETLRGAGHRRVPLVLIGQKRGPVKTALDAIDFAADRFLRAPVSQRALVFAVKALLTQPALARAVDNGAMVTVCSPGNGAEAVATPGLAARIDAALEVAVSEWIDETVEGALTAASDEREASWREPTQIVQQDVTAAGGFANEIRRAMSAIEQRLSGDGPPFPSDLVFDEGPEVDLATFDAPLRASADEDLALDDSATVPSRISAAGLANAADDMISNEETFAGNAPNVTRRVDLAVEDAASIFARLHREGFSGRIVFRRAEAEKCVHYDEGRPVFATSNLPHDRMGDLLYREGKITREQHAASREVLVETGRRLGEILVEMGFIKHRELLPAVRRHVEDIFYSVFAWDTGECVARTGAAEREEQIRLVTHPTALIVEGIRRKMGPSGLGQRLGGPAAVLVPAKRAMIVTTLADADLLAEERQMIGLFDGRRTLADVVLAAGLDELTVLQLTYALIVLQVIHPRALDAALAIGTSAGVNDDSARALASVETRIDRERVLAKHAQVVEADYFAILGVKRDVTGFEIRRAYEALRGAFAPESFPVEVQRDLASPLTEIAAVAEEAFRVLGDDRIRAQYLANLKG